MEAGSSEGFRAAQRAAQRIRSSPQPHQAGCGRHIFPSEFQFQTGRPLCPREPHSRPLKHYYRVPTFFLFYT